MYCFKKAIRSDPYHSDILSEIYILGSMQGVYLYFPSDVSKINLFRQIISIFSVKIQTACPPAQCVFAIITQRVLVPVSRTI